MKATIREVEKMRWKDIYALWESLSLIDEQDRTEKEAMLWAAIHIYRIKRRTKDETLRAHRDTINAMDPLLIRPTKHSAA